MNYLKIILLYSCMMSISNRSLAQTNSTDSYLPVVENVKTTYNNEDYKGFYELFSPEFKSHQTQKDIETFLKNNVYAYYGKMSAFVFEKEENGFKHYITNFEKGDLDMLLACDDKLQIIGFTFKPVTIKITSQNKVCSSSNKKQTALDFKVDSVVSGFMQNSANCGLSIAVIQNGNTFFYHYGEVKKNEKQLPSNSTIYEIGSLTKTFTGLLFANAIADNKLGLEDDIRKYLPAECSKLMYNNIPVTVKHLLTHTSRIPRIPENIDKQENFDELNPYKNYNKKMVYEYLSTLKLDTLPGIKMDYSNTGMALLGIILENVYKQPLESLYAKYITTPMEMKHTFVKVPKNELSSFAPGYNAKGIETPHWDLGDQVAAGGLRSTIADMSTYLRDHINEQSAIIRNSHEVQFEKNKQSVAYAWFVQPTKSGNTLVWHNGGTYGFTSFCGFVKEKKAGVVVLSNSGTGVDELAITLLRFLQ
jgi:CubicO group peptidase (beta-lactamase class C family)